MSIYDNAGVALIPSGTKASKLYSVLPANGDGDFTHSRGSTATRVNKDGFIESVATNVPRLDYPLIDGVVQDCPALLLEPSRTNLNTFSDPTDAQKGSTSYASVTFQDDFNWGLGSVLENAIVFGDNSTTRYAYYSSTVSSGTVYTLSFFIKMDDNSVPIPATDFLLVLAGTSIASGYNVDNYGNNVYRVSVTGTAGASNTANGILKVASNSSKTFKITGFQVEAGSYQTSYIKTTSGQVTRSQDFCNNSGTSADINSEEGVLFAELATLDKDDTSSRRISISDSTTNNVIRLTFDVASNRLYAVVYKLGTIWATFTTLSNSEDFNKVALKYKPSDFDFYVNGVKVQQQSSGATFDAGTMSEVAFDNGSGGNLFFGKVKQLIVFNEALSDSELATLTS